MLASVLLLGFITVAIAEDSILSPPQMNMAALVENSFEIEVPVNLVMILSNGYGQTAQFDYQIYSEPKLPAMWGETRNNSPQSYPLLA
jgi:hypothetical protein